MKKYAYINGIVLNGREDMKPEKGLVIFTEGEKITKICPEGAVLDGCEVIDLAGKYIMPGLINLHIHLPATGKPTKKQSDNAKKVKILTSNALFRKVVELMTASSAKTELLSGVTTVRTMGGVLGFDGMVRDKIYAGKYVGPRILAGNMGISVPGGHMAGSLAYMAESAEDAKNLVTKISEGNGTLEDLEAMERISKAMCKASLCGLGQSAANPVLSMLKYFKEEVVEHVVEKKCRAGKCTKMLKYKIDPAKCKGCTMCARQCPASAIAGSVKNPHVIDTAKCVKCGACMNTCKFGAISRG